MTPSSDNSDSPELPRPTYDATRGVYTVARDPSDGTDAVLDAILAIAEITGVQPVEMKPLYEDADPDMLDRLIRFREGAAVSVGDIEFAVHGHSVTVTEDGRIEIRPPDDGGQQGGERPDGERPDGERPDGGGRE